MLSQLQKRLARLIAQVRLPRGVIEGSHDKQFFSSRPTRWCRDPLGRSWTEWIHSTADWTTMVTLTFRRSSPKGFRVTQATVEKALKRILRLINCDLFGRRRTNKGWTIAFAVTVDFGALGDHPHAHLLLQAPAGVTEEQLCALVERAAQRTLLIDQQRVYRRYCSVGGAEYLIKHGTDRMVVSLLTQAHLGC